MRATPVTGFGDRIVRALLRLRAAGALEAPEVPGVRGVFRYPFLSGGWPVTIDIDRNVLEVRGYHDRDEIVMHRVTVPVMEMLLGERPLAESIERLDDPDEPVRELRQVVADWKSGNPRLFMRPPVKVGHPDNWNRA